MLWYEIPKLWYVIPMICYDISMLCYSMMYVVKDEIELTVLLCDLYFIHRYSPPSRLGFTRIYTQLQLISQSNIVLQAAKEHGVNITFHKRG